ncbi:MAG: IclR family transcriptional regulator [Propionicimonas sp.]|uniref:IclR family transcriptional regulator n=1 Tax=Propionicimonas sp. TaxID=1955623 RepID=UPI003D10EBAE
MTRPVPAATAALQVLRYLSQRTSPVPAQRIAQDLGLPRSSAYHLLRAMAEQSFVVHYPDDQLWGVGVAAWEVGQGYTRQAPLTRLARLPIARLVDGLGLSAHLAVLQGGDVVYLVEERAAGRPRLVTDVGVRLPAHLPASGRAILAELPPAQVRALYPSRASLVLRTDVGPRSLAELRAILAATRRRGWAEEDSEVTAGFASVAVPLRSASNQAAVAVTWESPLPVDREVVLERLRATAATIEARLR